MNFFKRFLPAAPQGQGHGSGPKVAQLIAQQHLGVVFQPMVNLQDGSICAYEALARHHVTQAPASAQTMFDAAKAQHQHKQLELACLELAINQWARKTNGAPLSLNISAASLVHLEHGPQDGALLQLIDRCRLPARMLTLEINHLKRGISGTDLAAVAAKLRKHQIRISLDDFRCTPRHMALWAALTPSVVKLHVELTEGVAQDPAKQKRLRALATQARRYGSQLAAKGVENADDISALNAAGVNVAQGYFLGSPDAYPIEALNLRALDALQSGWGPIDVTAAQPRTSVTTRH